LKDLRHLNQMEIDILVNSMINNVDVTSHKDLQILSKDDFCIKCQFKNDPDCCKWYKMNVLKLI
jgi:hypothetical protein